MPQNELRRRAKPATPSSPASVAQRPVSEPPHSRLVPRAISSLLLAWLGLSVGLHILAPSSVQIRLDERLTAARSVLIVIAHPDDESLMFAPTLLGLRSSDLSRNVSVLSLSTGDYEGLGATRQMEMQAACAQLSVSCGVIDDSALRDGPDQVWPLETIRAHVQQELAVRPVDAIITFDAHGVSGHANHRAVSEALTCVRSSCTKVDAHSSSPIDRIAVYTLNSQPLRRHYLGPLSTPIAWFSSSDASFISNPRRYLQARAAFAAHASQARWFRSLNVLFSSFLYSNTLTLVA